MKILMLGWELPPYHSGGLGEVSYEICRSLSKSVASIDFIVPYDAAHDIEFMNIHSALGVSPAQLRNGAGSYASTASLDTSENGFNFDGLLQQTKEYADRVGSRLHTHDFDVIHVHDWLTLRAGLLAKQLSGSPLFVHMHATQYDQAGGRYGNPAIHEIEEFGLSMADRIFAVSEKTKQTIVRHYGINPDDIEVVHNRIDANKYYYPDEQNPYHALATLKDNGYQVVSYLGRITIQKGLWTLLQGFAKVVERRPKSILLLAGTGEQLQELQELAAKLGIAQNVVFTGSFVSGNKQRWAFRVADLFVMPSVSEPFGITALEAPLLGAPVLISNQSGASEVLRNALKIDHWDVDQIANQICGALQSPGLRETLLRSSQQEIMKMTWDKATEQIKNAYHGVKA